MRASALIGICGPIGVGKTTLVAALARELEFEAWPERVDDNPFFARYLADRSLWALPSQVAFIVGALEDASAARRRPTGGVIERPAEEMLGVFGRYLYERHELDNEELALLTRIVALGELDAAPPDLLIVLRGEPRALLGRIKNRGRRGEDAYTLGDLELLDTAYSTWCSSLAPTRVLEIDAIDRDLRTAAEISRIAAETRTRLTRPR
jgi:deoxyguanosine kinase